MNKGTKESVKSNIGGILPNTIICERVFWQRDLMFLTVQVDLYIKVA